MPTVVLSMETQCLYAKQGGGGRTGLGLFRKRNGCRLVTVQSKSGTNALKQRLKNGSAKQRGRAKTAQLSMAYPETTANNRQRLTINCRRLAISWELTADGGGLKFKILTETTPSVALTRTWFVRARKKKTQAVTVAL